MPILADDKEDYNKNYVGAITDAPFDFKSLTVEPKHHFYVELSDFDLKKSEAVEDDGRLRDMTGKEKKKALNERNAAGSYLRHDLTLAFWKPGESTTDACAIMLPGCIAWRDVLTGKLKWAPPQLRTGYGGYLKKNIAGTPAFAELCIAAIEKETLPNGKTLATEIGKEYLSDPSKFARVIEVRKEKIATKTRVKGVDKVVFTPSEE